MIRHLEHESEERQPVAPLREAQVQGVHSGCYFGGRSQVGQGSCSDNMERAGVSKKRYLALGAAILGLSACALFSAASGKGSQTPLFAPVGESAAMPIGWAQFCETYEGICDTTPSTPRDVVLDGKAWSDLTAVDDWVNHNIRPETDMDHYGMIQWWRYPDDGAGSCHSYALLKRRLLIEAGWPREALLMTIVRTDYGRGEGHAVLTVKTDRGDFILDNLTDEIMLWSRTPYLYYKRQSQADPNAWVRISDTHVTGAMSGMQVR